MTIIIINNNNNDSSNVLLILREVPYEDTHLHIPRYKTRGCLNSLTRPFSFLLLVFVVVSY